VKEEWVTIVDNPDIVNGKHRTVDGYTSELSAVLQGLKGKFAAFIMESIVSVGGGVIPPKGYMASAFRMVREAGGVCIADETQIGLGRTGNWWAFEGDGDADAAPDILVIGKQLGNGFPISLVVASEEIVRSLERTRIDYFSTFGGSSVSCAAALATVTAIKADNLVEQARCMGAFMMQLLKQQLEEIMGEELWLIEEGEEKNQLSLGGGKDSLSSSSTSLASVDGTGKPMLPL
jgi:ethanolamine-phosphate phospho-lyase